MSALPISELSTVECVRNGIAEIEKGKAELHIRYEAKIKLGADFQKLDIQIDDEEKTVQFVVPEVSVLDIIIDPASLSFIPSNPTDIEVDEILTTCKEDAARELEEDYTLKEIGQNNFMSIIEGFLRPLVKESEYTASWMIERIQIVRENRKWQD